MKVLVISDTHGDITAWEKIQKENFYDAQLIIHAGDVLYHGPRNDLPAGYQPKKLIEAVNNCPVPIIVAQGNCEAYVDQMVLNIPIQAPYAFLQLEDKRFLVNHGHLLSSEEMDKQANLYKIDFFITGHTHVPVLEKRNQTIFLNPGSTSISKRADKKQTVAVIDDRQVVLLDLDTGEIIEQLSY